MKHLLLVLLVASVAIQAWAAQTPAPNFSGYAQDEGFVYFIKCHTVSPQAGDLLAITVFLDRSNCALQYHVTESGQADDCRHIYSYAVQASHRKQLSVLDLNKLQTVVRELPAKHELPPVERLVVVSYRDGATWTTHSYDRNALPEAVRKIYDIIGERFETRKQDSSVDAVK